MFNFFKSKKEILLSDMHEIYHGINAAGEGRKSYAQSWNDFAKFAKAMILTQNPGVTDKLDQFVDLCAKYAESQTRLAQAEIRNSEDFRDVAERFTVVYRANNEYIDQKRKFRELEEALKNAIKKNEEESQKPNYAKNQAKLEGNIEKLRTEKKEAYELTKQKLRFLIDTRNRYNAFKIRRFCHGWSLLGETLKAEGQTMSQVLDQISECLSSLSLSPESAAEVKQAVQDQVAAAPSTNYAEQPVESNPSFGGYD